MDKDYINQVKMYVQAEDELKQKLAEIRINKDMRSLQMVEDFQPIIKPLNQTIINNNELIDTLKETLTETAKIKNEPDFTFLQKSLLLNDFDDLNDSGRFKDYESSINETPTPSEKKDRSFSTPATSEKKDNSFSTPKDDIEINKNETSTPVKFIQDSLGNVALKYLNNDSGNSDNIFGLRSENNSKYIGDSEVKIEHNDIIVKDKKYSGTKGLWELMTLKEPNDNNYTDDDYNNYANIILSTFAYMQNNDKTTKRVKSSGGYKYKNIIRPILLHHGILKDKTTKEEKKGEGMYNINSKNSNLKEFKNKTKNNIEYKYWNDINELKDRLNLLIGESNAGNDDPLIHNEILNIIEELREEGIV